MATCDVSVHSWRFKLRVQIIVGTPETKEKGDCATTTFYNIKAWLIPNEGFLVP